MDPSKITSSKIHRVSLDWANLIFKHEENTMQLHITKRKHLVYYGYIDLDHNKAVPNSYGISYKKELESILKDLIVTNYDN